jgi:3-deoxy-D-manno-octulosonic-acid transferase
MQAYDALWRLALPLLRGSARLREGFAQRTLAAAPPGPAELWIQAASVGEAYLAGELVGRLFESCRPRTLLTTGTAQGRAILEAARRRAAAGAACRLFPFDRPALMCGAVRRIAPRLLVLIEAELWPGLMYACRRHGVRVLIVNGRLTAKSLRRYRLWPGFWRALRPEAVLAVSPEDAARFDRLFGPGVAGVMPNMKFDRLAPAGPAPDPAAEALRPLLPEAAPFIVIGSVRRGEEAAVARMLSELRAGAPAAAIGLFPRHLHRVPAWSRRLERMGLPWVRRSGCTRAAAPGGVILWDAVGELAAAYRLASAAFVGGSLAPHGGQNFLEALAAGIRPVIGPSWENFSWVGRGIVSEGLLRTARDGGEAARLLLAELRQAPPKEEVRRRFAAYVSTRRGGVRIASERVAAMLGR